MLLADTIRTIPRTIRKKASCFGTLELKLPRFDGRVWAEAGLLMRIVCLYPYSMGRDSPGPSGGVRDCRSLR